MFQLIEIRQVLGHFGRSSCKKGLQKSCKYIDRYNAGQQKKAENAKKKSVSEWKSQISNNPKPSESAKRYDGGTPLGQSAQTRQPEQNPPTTPTNKGDA